MNITVEEMLENACEPSFENVGIWDLDAEEEVYCGLSCDIPDKYKNANVESWNTFVRNGDAYICLNVTK